jgi:ABC-type sugar transport system ATPase subunit
MIAGRPLDQVFPRKMQDRGELKLEVKDLSAARFARINFSAYAREIVGVTEVEGGSSGCRRFRVPVFSACSFRT